MKAENGKTVRDRKVDPNKRLQVIRDFSQLEDSKVCQVLKAKTQQGSALQKLRTLSTCSIETPCCRPINKWYESDFFGRKRYIVPEQYIRISEERQKAPQTGLEYDLDEEDEAWLSCRKRHRVTEDDLENILIRLEFALHATKPPKDRARAAAHASVSDSLPRESALAILAARGFSHLTYQDLTELYKYWVQKRDKAQRSLLVCLQPPPALDDNNPYDLFCGHDKRSSKENCSTKPSKLRRLSQHVGCHSLWQPSSDVELSLPAGLSPRREHKPATLRVTCGGATATLLWGLRRGEERVSYKRRIIHPSEFIARIGMASDAYTQRVWKTTLRVSEGDRGDGPSLSEWLRVKGREVGGQDVFGSVVSVYDPKLDHFRCGIIQDFDRANGQHLVLYLNGVDREWLYLQMEWVKWLPSRSEDFGIQVPKRVGPRTPLRNGRRVPRIPQVSKGGSFSSRRALQFQLTTVQGWLHTALHSFFSLASSIRSSASRLAAAAGPPVGARLKRKRGEGDRTLPEVKKRKKKSAAADGSHAGPPASSSRNPELLPVAAGDLEGFLVSGSCHGRKGVFILVDNKEITPAEFLVQSGMSRQQAHRADWASIIQVNRNHAERQRSPGGVVGDWLRARGHETGQPVVGKGVGVYRPDSGAFQWGNVLAFDRLSGKHLLQFENGRREWLWASIHFMKYGKK